MAKAPYQVTEDLVQPLLTGDDRRFVRILSWASFTGARRFANILASRLTPAVHSGAA
ncbi:MAG: hypothetical protein ACYTGX_17260 [Planctomycetota bacterium]